MSRKLTKLLIVVALLLSFLLLNTNAHACCVGDRGNVDSLSDVNVSDLTYLVEYLFKGGPPPACQDEADVNADSALNVDDLTYLVSYLFKGGTAPEPCQPNTNPDVLINLNVGTWFVTDVTEYNTSGGIDSSYQTLSTVISDTLIADSLWMVVEDTTSIDHTYTVNRVDGVWYWSDTLTPPEALALKYPATVGDSYPYYDATVYVVSIDEQITVPAGTFSCYYYRVDVPVVGTLAKIWCAPNIGIVKAEEYGLNLIWPYLKTKIELANYQLVP